MRRIYTRGNIRWNKFMLFAAIVYNLKKYMKFISRKSNVKVMALKGELLPFILMPLSGFIKFDITKGNFDVQNGVEKTKIAISVLM